ncbi:hypothetical protein BKH43_02035 [Helicobacter sp. 13S00401-1]|uniref:metallophosphoesterase n=1 Tax=Helicobacter sp. 13S00401-1 TaxID=1905758 RepID=UPI000BA6CF0E|nr:metallophosphoesterase [Helicobacter sp. 13S00401-1]PAF51443.1 hypothetical protein BKH43_02035 [Helicobacter sp. 13S00401-1]
MHFIEDFYIKKGAMFIADSHFKMGDIARFDALKDIKDSQIFLMGDIFHVLMGNLKRSIKENLDLIHFLEKLAKKNDIYYLAGNHDMHLTLIDELSGIKIFPHKLQPIILKDYMDRICILAHGDLWINTSYDAYARLMSEALSGKCLRYLDKITFGKLYSKIRKKVYSKPIIRMPFSEERLERFARYRVELYKKKVFSGVLKHYKKPLDSKFCIIEGHFHLNRNYTFDNVEYVGLDAFYFEGKPFIL